VAGSAGAGADHARHDHGHFLVGLTEIQKYSEAVGFGGLALKLRNGQLEFVILRAEFFVLAGSALQGEVVVPHAANLAESPGAALFKRRYRAHAPDADQAAAGIALYLQRQHQHLSQQYTGKQCKGSMSGRHSNHGKKFSVNRS